MTNAVDTNFSALLQMPAWHFLFYFLKRCTTCVSSKDTREASSSETLLQSVASSAYSMLSSSSSTISVCGVSYFLNLQFSLWLQIFRTQVLHRCEDMLLQEHVLIFMILSQGIKCFSLVLGLGFFEGEGTCFFFFSWLLLIHCGFVATSMGLDWKQKQGWQLGTLWSPLI